METKDQHIDQPLASPQDREVLTALKEMAKRWHANAQMLAEGNKSEGYDEGAGMQQALATELDAAIAKAESAPSVGQQESELRAYVQHQKGCRAVYCRDCGCHQDASWAHGAGGHEHMPMKCTCGLAELLASSVAAAPACTRGDWAVTVERAGEQVVSIEPRLLSGRDLSADDEAAIRTAAHQLLAFIGDRAAAPAWRAMDSAPKDGTRVIGWGPQLAVAECEYRQEWHGQPEGWYRSNQHPRVEPTHWMPLPRSPRAGEET